jgi:hypothetical protein
MEEVDKPQPPKEHKQRTNREPPKKGLMQKKKKEPKNLRTTGFSLFNFVI